MSSISTQYGEAVAGTVIAENPYAVATARVTRPDGDPGDRRLGTDSDHDESCGPRRASR